MGSGVGGGRRESSRLKDIIQGASATAAGREFQAGMVLGKKVIGVCPGAELVLSWRKRRIWLAVVLEDVGVR
jgi:hypothetical protein